MKILQTLRKEKNGNTYMLYVILMVTCMFGITAFFDMTVRSFYIGEVQSQMDLAGISALHSGVDQVKLRLGTFEVNEDIVKSKYEELIRARLKQMSQVKSFQIDNIETEVFNENWGLGVSKNSHPQALINSTIIIDVEGSTTFDTVPGVSKTFYNSRSNENVTVTYLGKTGDGQVELALRSVTRLVYR